MMNTSWCRAQCSFDWGRTVGTESNSQCTSVAVDAQGAVLAAGYFSGSIRFDSITLSAQDNFSNPYIAKYDRDGVLAWAVHTPGARLAYGIAVDRDGNSSITGYFGERAIAGADTALSKGDQDIYLAKYDAGGKPLWLRGLGGDSLDVGRAVAADRAGNLYVAGHFTHEVVDGARRIVSRGGNDVLIAKYDAAGTLRRLGSAGGGGDDRAYAIAAADDGVTYLCGVFEGAAVFGADTLQAPAGGFAPFVAALDSSGQFRWARAPGVSIAGAARGIAVGKGGAVYVAGEFEGTIIMGRDTLRTHGVRDMFLARLDTAGRFVWARGAGGAAQDGANAVATDSAGRVYCTGLVADPAFGPVYFDDDTVAAKYGAEIFAAEYDSTGRILCTRTAGGTSSDFGNAVAGGAASDVYIAGTFSEAAEFGAFTLQGDGPVNSSGFLARFHPAPAAAVRDPYEASSPLTLSPNPSSGHVLIGGLPYVGSQCTVTIADLMGHTIVRSEGVPVDRSPIRCDLSALARGVYLVCVTADGVSYRRMLVLR